MRARWIFAWTLCAALGCDGTVVPEDSGMPRDAGPDTGTVEVCDRDSLCDDGVFCNGVERCMPGAPSADARGCVPGMAPCAAGEVCVEAEDRCEADDCADGGDADGDGERRPECGGNDCDDDDGSRYPSNTEVCDDEGHDEDCNGATYGDTDADTDGFVSAACCNGTTCGPDCNDGDPDANPTQLEVCNAGDDDCDGSVDEEPMESLALCPGGMCVGGRCSFTAWDRVVAAPLDDYGTAAAMDAAGNVYVVGRFRGTVTVGGVTYPEVNQSDFFVMSYGPDGSIRWFTPIGSGGVDEAYDVAVGTTGTVFVTGRLETSRFDFGFGERTNAPATTLPFLLGVSAADGAVLWDRTFNQAAAVAAAADGGVFVTTASFGTRDVGGGPVPELGGSGGDLHLVKYDASGAYVWDRRFAGEGSLFGPRVISSADAIAVFGGYTGTQSFDGTARASMDRDYFVALFDPTDGAIRWIFSHAGAGFQSATAAVIDSTGAVFVVGNNGGTVSFGGGRTHTATTSTELWTLRLDSTGAYAWHRTQQATNSATGTGLAMDASGDLVMVGHHVGSIDLGGGPFLSTRAGAGASGFVARYASTDGRYLSDNIFSSGSEAGSGVYFEDVAVGPGGTRAIVGWFRGSANFGLGTRSSTGSDVVTIRQAP